MKRFISLFLVISLFLSVFGRYIYMSPVHAWIDPRFAVSYYSGTSWDPFNPTNFILSRIDDPVFFNWGTGSPDPSIPSNGFTGR